jgi:hypothetical protein
MADEAKEKPTPKIIFTMKLTEPITAHGEKLTELNFREPTAKDIIQYGYPVIPRFNAGEFTISYNEEKMTAIMCGLLAVPPSSIAQLKTRDWATAAAWLATFFVPDIGLLLSL